MSLDEFLTEERARIAAFEKFWRDGVAASPERFPTDLGLGDWDEQLLMFIDEGAWR